MEFNNVILTTIFFYPDVLFCLKTIRTELKSNLDYKFYIRLNIIIALQVSIIYLSITFQRFCVISEKVQSSIISYRMILNRNNTIVLSD